MSAANKSGRPQPSASRGPDQPRLRSTAATTRSNTSSGRADTVDGGEQPAGLEPVAQRSGLLLIQLQTALYRLESVVGAAPVQHPGRDLGDGHVDVQGHVETVAPLVQDGLQGVGLIGGTRVAVEQHPGLRNVVAGQPVAHDPVHDVVAYQPALVHDGLGLPTQLGAGRHRGPQDVARGQMHTSRTCLSGARIACPCPNPAGPGSPCAEEPSGATSGSLRSSSSSTGCRSASSSRAPRRPR